MLSLLALLTLTAAVQDLGHGTWYFVQTASTYQSGPAPKESKRQWIPEGEKVKFVHDGISAEGKPFHTEFTAAYDGKPYPFIGGTLYDAVALTSRGPSRVDQVFTLKGKVTVKATRTISKDGKRMAIDSRGTKPDGTSFRNLLIYERR